MNFLHSLLLAFAAVAGAEATAQCTKDYDCEGDLVCVERQCVSPEEQKLQGPVKYAVAFHPLPLFIGLVQRNGFGGQTPVLEFELVAAASPYLSIYGQVAPIFYWYSMLEFGGAGIRFHFQGNAPGGLWVGLGMTTYSEAGRWSVMTSLSAMLGYAFVAGSFYCSPAVGFAQSPNGAVMGTAGFTF